jgi:hypothetical protein
MTLIEDCENRPDKLDNWEKNLFLPSVKGRLERRIFLSDKQLKKLNQIWERVTKQGGAYVKK